MADELPSLMLTVAFFILFICVADAPAGIVGACGAGCGG